MRATRFLCTSLVAAAGCAGTARTTTGTQASTGCPEVQPVVGRIMPGELPAAPDVKAALDEAFARGGRTTGGKNADYIPVLAKVDSRLFSIVVVTTDGQVFTRGDSEHRFSIQSVEKPFTMARDLEDLGAKTVEDKIGVAATGLPFNSILAIELERENRPAPGNPLVNAGAIVAVSLLPGRSSDERWQKLLGNLSEFAGRSLTVDQEVYSSEAATNTRNRAIAWLMTAYESMGSDPMEALDLYTRACSVAVSARDLAVMGATLANGGVNPITGRRVVSESTASKVLSEMMTAGLYEKSGNWAYEVGVPAKSGVGGGIVAVVPGRYAIGTFAPPLDEAGNSVRGQAAIAALVTQLGGNVFASSARTPGAQGAR